MMILLVFFSIFFAALAVYNLELAVGLLIFLLPTYLIRFQVGPLPLTLLEVMIWLVFLAWFIKYSGLTRYLKGGDKIKRFLADRKKKNAYPFGPEIISLVIISFVAAGIAGFTNSSLGIWKAYFFEPILLYIVVLNVFSNGFKLPKLLWPLCLSALAVSLLAIYQKITGDLIENPFWAAAATRRAVSFFGYPNAVGLYLGPITMLLAGLLIALIREFKQNFSRENYFKSFYSLKFVRILLVFFSLHASLLAIVYATSAGAMLGVTAGLAVFCLLANRRARTAVIVIAAIAAIGCAAVPLTRHRVLDKLMLRDFSGTVRRIGWNDTWKMLSDGRLIFGAGLANFQTAVRPYHQAGFFVSDGTPDFWQRLATDVALRARTWQPLEIYLYPHNIFLNFWSELGLVGMLLFIWIIGKYLFIAINNYQLRITNYKFLTLGLISAMVVVVIHGLVDVPYFKNDLAVMFWLLVAMLGIINSYQTKNTL